MSIVLSSSRRRRLLYLLDRPHFLRRLSAEPDPLPAEQPGLSFFDYLHEKSESLQLRDGSLSSAFQSVIELAGREPEPGDKLLQLYEAAKERNIPLNVNAVKSLIRLFGRLGMANQSVLVYEELDPSLKNTHVRNVMIHVLFRDGLVDDAFKVLDEMLQRGSDSPPDEITRDIVFREVWRGGPRRRRVSEDEILGLLSKFSSHGVFPSCVWLTQFITNLCNKGRTDVAWDTLMEMMNEGARLEAPPFNALMQRLGRDSDFARMNALSEKMEEMGIRPDAVTFGIFMNTLCKARCVDEALEVFERMRGKETGVKADVIHCNTLVNGLGKLGRMKEAEEFLTQMKTEEGCRPNTITFNCLIDGYCRAGQLETAKEVVCRMKDEGIQPNVVTLNTIVGCMCKHHGVSTAVQFFADMQREGLKGNVVTYTLLINAYCNVNNIGHAMHWFEQMFEAGCSPDAKVYYLLLSGLCQARMDRDAVSVVEKLKRAGFALELVAYNMLIGMFCSKNKPEKVYEMLADMEESGVNPDQITYNTLISFLGKHMDFGSIKRMLEKMRDDGLVPTVVTYGAIIEAYCSAGDTGEAMKLFNDMGSRSAVTPDTAIYNILINCFCKNGSIDEALSLKEEMRAKRVRPNVETFNALFKGLKDRNRPEKALGLMDEMIEHSCKPNYITCEVLMDLLSEAGQIEKLKKFMQRYQVIAPSDKAAPLNALR